MSIETYTTKVFVTWQIAPFYSDLFTGPGSLAEGMALAQDGYRVHNGTGYYPGDLCVAVNDFMLQGTGTISAVVGGNVSFAPGATGDVFRQEQVTGAVDATGAIDAQFIQDIFHADVTIAGNATVTACQFRDGAGLITANNGTFDFASGHPTHSVHALLGLDGTETDIVTGWHNGLDHLDLADADLSVLSVDHFRRETVFHLCNGGTVDILSRNAML